MQLLEERILRDGARPLGGCFAGGFLFEPSGGCGLDARSGRGIRPPVQRRGHHPRGHHRGFGHRPGGDDRAGAGCAHGPSSKSPSPASCRRASSRRRSFPSPKTPATSSRSNRSSSTPATACCSSTISSPTARRPFGGIRLLEQAGATVAGVGAVIAKAFQPGMGKLRAAGYRVEALAAVAEPFPRQDQLLRGTGREHTGRALLPSRHGRHLLPRRKPHPRLAGLHPPRGEETGRDFLFLTKQLLTQRRFLRTAPEAHGPERGPAKRCSPPARPTAAVLKEKYPGKARLCAGQRISPGGDARGGCDGRSGPTRRSSSSATTPRWTTKR